MLSVVIRKILYESIIFFDYREILFYIVCVGNGQIARSSVMPVCGWFFMDIKMGSGIGWPAFVCMDGITLTRYAVSFSYLLFIVLESIVSIATLSLPPPVSIELWIICFKVMESLPVPKLKEVLTADCPKTWSSPAPVFTLLP